MREANPARSLASLAEGEGLGGSRRERRGGK